MKYSVFHSGLTGIGASWLCGVCLLAWGSPARASDEAGAMINYAPPESWVTPQFFTGATAPPDDSTADDRLLLLDRQVNALENEDFYHSDRQILTEDGVQNDSTLKINFDPSYETLTLHWVRLWRGTQHFDRLDTNKIQIVRQEEDLDASLLNGEESAILVLDDVRAGDVIDYAYTLKGDNPVFGGHFWMRVPVQTGEPAGRYFTRLWWPRQEQIYAMPHGCSVRPVTIVDKDRIEFDWDFREQPAVTVEDSLPAWYDPEHWVQLSDFGAWAQVNAWALALFQYDAKFSPELTAKIAQWRQIEGQEQQILAVLRFVQDQVRYFGMEIGASGAKPADPSTVFSRRFGDCKDKSLLFVAILRAMGIEAWPELVNSTLGIGIENWQPSANAFDHCIAKVYCNGQAYWLDPTINYQRGSLAAHFLPAYGCGLVIAPGTTRLTPIPQTTGLPLTTILEYFKIGRLGQPSSLKVVTTAEGRDADIARAVFATTRLSDIEKSSTHFYSDTYPDIQMSSPMVTSDDEQNDVFRTTQFYTIDKMWTQPDNGKFECDFFPYAINDLLKKPVDTDRTLPLGVDFPEHEVVRTEVILPEDWPAESGAKVISDPAFTFRKDYWCGGGNEIVMKYEYQSLADSVSADRVPGYLQNLNQCSPLLGNTLVWR